MAINWCYKHTFQNKRPTVAHHPLLSGIVYIYHPVKFPDRVARVAEPYFQTVEKRLLSIPGESGYACLMLNFPLGRKCLPQHSMESWHARHADHHRHRRQLSIVASMVPFKGAITIAFTNCLKSRVSSTVALK